MLACGVGSWGLGRARWGTSTQEERCPWKEFSRSRIPEPSYRRSLDLACRPRDPRASLFTEGRCWKRSYPVGHVPTWGIRSSSSGSSSPREEA